MDINFDCLKEIDYQATNDGYRVHGRENTMSITDDMIDVIDYIRAENGFMQFEFPQFSSGDSLWFSYSGRLYRYLNVLDNIYITVDSFIGDEDEDEDYTFKEFLSDYDVYYYLDLDTMTVKSLWDNKEYIIKENV